MSDGLATYSNGVANSLFTISTRCQVRVGSSAADSKVIGFVDSASFTKQIQTQKAQVLDSIWAASIDPQAVSVSGQLSGFLASPAVYSGTASYNGGGTIALSSFNPSSSDFVNGTVITKFDYMDFYDEKKGLILCAISSVIPTSYAVQLQAGNYVKVNISIEAIDMSSGKEYEEQTDKETTTA